MSKIADAQAHIDGTLVAQMIIEFQNEFSDTYHTGIIAGLGAVGPLQSLIGLAIRNGHLTPTSRAALEGK